MTYRNRYYLCYQPIRALEHARGLVAAENRDPSLAKNTIIGVVGASYSSVTKPLSKATLAMKLPLISYAATNRDLSHHKGRRINRSLCP